MGYNTRYRSFNDSSFLPTGVKWLLISNVVIFLLFYIAPEAVKENALMLSLVPVMVLKHFAIWQLATYMFLHGGIEHILFNMLALWMFGTPLEQDWGTRRFLKYYFICGIGAGLFDLALNILLGNWRNTTIGASGAIYGLLLAFGVCYPDQTVLMSFLFPIKAKYMVMIYAAIELYMSMGAGNSGVSNVAHLGGMAVVFVYLKTNIWRARAPRLNIPDRPTAH